MNTPLILFALITSFGLLLACRLPAQTFTVLHSFTFGAGHTPNSDGASPTAGLVSSGSSLYGTAEQGGSSGYGTLFAVSTDGTGFSVLHDFTAPTFVSPTVYTNSDGFFPGLLILSSNTLYGAAGSGGGAGNGTIFKVRTDGTGFATLYSFTASSTNLLGVYTNSDGASSQGVWILSGNTLYGTASQGGSSGNGTVFKLNTDGTGFSTLHSFIGLSDGAGPDDLTLSGNTLYGTASRGCSSGNGTVFAVNTDGTSFTNLHIFTLTSGPNQDTNSDGRWPNGLVLSGHTLYGTTSAGGGGAFGTVFAVNTDGTGFTNLHSFTRFGSITTEGDVPGGLVLSGNTLYGTAVIGGSAGNGTVFSISFRPQLTITPSGTNVILTWPTNVTGFDYTGYSLQSTTNLLSPAAWVTNSPAPVVVKGQNTVTNPISGAQQFYRLIR